MMQRNPYVEYYRSQIGGSADIPVFVGGQHGEGVGDFFRGVLRFIAPIALRTLGTFASSALQSHQGGASLKDAARSAITPSLNTMVGAVREGLANRQSGSGSDTEQIPALLYKGQHKALNLKRPFEAPVKHHKKQSKKRLRDGYNF